MENFNDKVWYRLLKVIFIIAFVFFQVVSCIIVFEIYGTKEIAPQSFQEVGKLVIPKAGGDYSLLSYNYSSNVNYTIAEIYPILNGKICDMSDSIKLNNC